MQGTTTEIIAKEGWKFALVTGVLFIIAIGIGCGEWLFLFLFLLTLFVFRNPERMVGEDDPLAIIAPIDGKIKSIDRIENDGGGVKVTIESSLFDVSLLRSPTGLNIEETKRSYGLSTPISSKNSLVNNNRTTLTCKRRDTRFKLQLVGGLWVTNIALYKTRGPLKQGQRFGAMVDGQVILYLPKNVRINAAIGDSVKGGETTLGYFSYDKEIDAAE